MLASVDSAKLLRKSIARNLATRERLRAQRQAALEEKLRQGLAGQRIGKHVVPEGAIDVQLGDELSESLRGLKVRPSPLRLGVGLGIDWCSLARGQPLPGSFHQHATPCAHRAACAKSVCPVPRS